MTHRLWNDEMDVQERAGRQRPGRPIDQKLACEPVKLNSRKTYQQSFTKTFL